MSQERGLHLVQHGAGPGAVGGLFVVLDGPRDGARGAAAILERQIGSGGGQDRHLCLTQQVTEDDRHYAPCRKAMISIQPVATDSCEASVAAVSEARPG